MGFALAELMFAPIVLAVPVLIVIALADLASRPEAEWRAAELDRLVWALIVIFVAVVGPVLYLAIARPKLAAARLGGAHGVNG